MGSPVVINESPSAAVPQWTQVGINSLTTSNCLNNKTVCLKSNLTKDNFIIIYYLLLFYYLFCPADCASFGMKTRVSAFRTWIDQQIPILLG